MSYLEEKIQLEINKVCDELKKIDIILKIKNPDINQFKRLLYNNSEEDLVLDYNKIDFTVDISSISVKRVVSFMDFLSVEFIEYFKDYLDWVTISASRKNTEDFVIKFVDKILFRHLRYNQNFNFQSCSHKFKLLYGKYFI